MNLNTFFKARFKTTLAGMDFLAEVDCGNLAELQEKCHGSQLVKEDIELVAAMIGLELAKPQSGCYDLDGDSEQLLAQVMKELGVGAEHFLNSRIGSYDKYNNRITPADLGIVFPDGSMRIVWDQEDAKQDFDTCLTIIKGTVELLLQAQELPYFKPSEAEFEDCVYEGVIKRRTALLFEAGFWPADDDTFEPKSEEEVAEILAKYAGMAIPEATPA